MGSWSESDRENFGALGAFYHNSPVLSDVTEDTDFPAVCQFRGPDLDLSYADFGLRIGGHKSKSQWL